MEADTVDEPAFDPQRPFITAVRGRIQFGMDLDPPSAEAAPAGHALTLAASLAAKATVYVLWRRSGQSKVALAKAQDINEKEAQRVLDPNYPTASRPPRRPSAIG